MSVLVMGRTVHCRPADWQERTWSVRELVANKIIYEKVLIYKVTGFYVDMSIVVCFFIRIYLKLFF